EARRAGRSPRSEGDRRLALGDADRHHRAGKGRQFGSPNKTNRAGVRGFALGGQSRVADAARSILNLWVQKWTGGLWKDKQRKKLSHARKTLRSLGTPGLSSGHARHRRMGRELHRRRGHGMALQAEGRSTALGGAR